MLVFTGIPSNAGNYHYVVLSLTQDNFSLIFNPIPHDVGIQKSHTFQLDIASKVNCLVKKNLKKLVFLANFI